jgi:hypothetical protein
VPKVPKLNRYGQLIEHIFFEHWKEGAKVVEFERHELESSAKTLGIKLPKNQGDVLYSFRFRYALPASIVEKAPEDMEWVIETISRAGYAFRLVPMNRISPNPAYEAIKIPDATPEIITQYAQGDEQALLAKVRYNRLIDIFLGLTTYSLQNHLRTTVRKGVQIEVDELYVGVDREGRHYLIPVQAKGGKDQLSVVQTKQDLDWCELKYPELAAMPVSVQFMSDERIAMFLLKVEDDQMFIRQERHYQLVPGADINPKDWLPRSNS